MCKPAVVVVAGWPGVQHVRIVRDRGTGHSRGFGFVVSCPATCIPCLAAFQVHASKEPFSSLVSSNLNAIQDFCCHTAQSVALASDATSINVMNMLEFEAML